MSNRFHLRTAAAQRSCCMVAHRPAACSLDTSTSIDSRVPADTTALPSFVDLEHELGGVRFGVAEQLLEDVGHVVHQVDRIVPDDGDPGPLGGLGRVGLILSGRSRVSSVLPQPCVKEYSGLEQPMDPICGVLTGSSSRRHRHPTRSNSRAPHRLVPRRHRHPTPSNSRAPHRLVPRRHRHPTRSNSRAPHRLVPRRHRHPLPCACDRRAADRQVRTDDVASRSARRLRAPAHHLRTVRPAAARRTPLRRGRGDRTLPGSVAPVPVRRRGASSH